MAASLNTDLRSDFCLIRNTHKGEVVCRGQNSRVMGLVFWLIGSAFVVSGLYLLLAGTGTIPALISGWGLLAAGGIVLTLGTHSLFRASKRCA